MKKLFALGLIMALSISPAQAGVIYTDEAVFDAALAAAAETYSELWSEDFEGFATGVLPDTTLIGGGAAEVTGMLAAIEDFGFSNIWAGSGAAVDGPGVSGLSGVEAFSFDFASIDFGTWEFVTSEGIDVSGLLFPSVPLMGFVGWIGDTGMGETLTATSFSEASLEALDNITAYTTAPVPAPMSLGLLLLGLGMIVSNRVFKA